MCHCQRIQVMSPVSTQNINIWSTERALKPLLALLLPWNKSLVGYGAKRRQNYMGLTPSICIPLSSQRLKVEEAQTQKNIRCDVRHKQKTPFKQRKKESSRTSAKVEKTIRVYIYVHFLYTAMIECAAPSNDLSQFWTSQKPTLNCIKFYCTKSDIQTESCCSTRKDLL